MSMRVEVFGPAYLDRVLRVDRPLVAPGISPPLDQSVEGAWEFGPGLAFVWPGGSRLEVALPPDWPGPTGVVALSTEIVAGAPSWRRSVVGTSWGDDLGGMGAGFAAALGGRLICVLGRRDDPTAVAVKNLIAARGLIVDAVRVDRPADWTLLLTSGEHGDKLPVGFRGATEPVGPTDLADLAGECDLRVVAGLPNHLAAAVLAAPGAGARLFAPTVRNMTDRRFPVRRFIEDVDLLCCNRREWELLEDREQVAWLLPVLAITDGPDGAVVRFTAPDGEPGRVHCPAFPRSRPPRDTNRAGEAFASSLVRSILRCGWTGGVIEPDDVRSWGARASASAALVLDRLDFGFPTDAEVGEALAYGRVD